MTCVVTKISSQNYIWYCQVHIFLWDYAFVFFWNYYKKLCLDVLKNSLSENFQKEIVRESRFSKYLWCMLAHLLNLGISNFYFPKFPEKVSCKIVLVLFINNILYKNISSSSYTKWRRLLGNYLQFPSQEFVVFWKREWVALTKCLCNWSPWEIWLKQKQ